MIYLKLFFKRFFSVLFFLNILFAQPDLLWEKTIGTEIADKGINIQQTSDGGFIIVGQKRVVIECPGGGNCYALWLIKTDVLGDTLWSQVYDEYAQIQKANVQELENGGYIIAYTVSGDGWLKRTDSNGETLWTSTYGEPGLDDSFTFVQQTDDYGFIITGSTESYANGEESDAWLIKVDAEGNEEWNNTYGEQHSEKSNFVHQVNDGGGYIFGGSYGYVAYDGSQERMWLCKTNVDGNLVWSHLYQSDEYDGPTVGLAFDNTSDGGYIIGGKVTNNEIERQFFVKTDSVGNQIWNKVIRDNHNITPTSVKQTNDQGYIVTGITTITAADTMSGFSLPFLMKISSLGSLSWISIFQNENYEQVFSDVKQTLDYGYVITGHRSNYGFGPNLLIMRFDSHYDGPDWYVSKNGNDNNEGTYESPFLNIQYTIDKASDGDSIFVNTGVYFERLTFSKKVNLKSIFGPVETVIDGYEFLDLNFFDNDWESYLVKMNDNSTLEGFTLLNAPDYGILIDESSNVSIKRNIINTNGQSGIRLNNSQSYILNNTIVNCSWGGITFSSSAGNVFVRNNIIAFNEKAGIDNDNFSDNWNIDFNIFFNPGSEYGDIRAENGIGSYNLYSDPLFSDINFENSNYTLQINSPCIDSGDPDLGLDQDGSIADMGAIYFENNQRSIWNVSIDGSDDNDGSELLPFLSIQAAINASSDGDTVLVAPGYYTENINYNGKNIVVGSSYLITNDTSYVSSTIIDGDNLGPVVLIEDIGSSVKLIGFTLINGMSTNGGGGIRNINSNSILESLKIKNCYTMTGGNGGGIYLSGSNSNLKNISLNENSADGLGGGVYSELGEVTITNSLINNNTASFGGGIYFSDGIAEIINSTIVYNHGSYGIYGHANLPLDGQAITIVMNISNSIVWGNAGVYQFYFDNDAAITVNNVCSQGTEFLDTGYDTIPAYGFGVMNSGVLYANDPSGANNINLFPSFINQEQGDYRLSNYSPLIGVGTVIGAPITDIDGSPRPNPEGSNPDIGAYENLLGVPANAPPTVSEMILTINEDEVLNGTFSVDDVNEEDILTFSITTEPSNGTIIINENNELSFIYSPEENYYGEDSFSFIASDGTDVSDIAMATITINPVNDAPVLDPIADQTIDEDFQGDLNLRAEVTDVENDEVEFSSSSTEFVSTYFVEQNLYVMPLVNWFGEQVISVYATDSGGLMDTVSFSLTVLPINDVPVGESSTLSMEEDAILNSSLNASDAENDPITFSLVDISSGIVDLNSDNGDFIYTPYLNFNGLDTLTFTASDGQDTGVEAHIIIEVTPVNDAPVFSTMIDTTMDEDSELSLALSATDVDGDFLYYEVDEIEHISAYIYGDGDSILFVPEPNWNGVSTVTLHVMDSEGLSDMVSFNLTVNSIDDEPTLDGYIENIFVYEDFQDTTLMYSLDSLFSDIDGELTYSVELIDPTVIHAEIENSFLSLSSLPNAFGETIMTVTASNPMRASISDTVTVVVFAENDAPVFTEMEPIILNEDETVLLSSITELQEAGIFEDVDTELTNLMFDLFSNDDHIDINWDGSISSNPELIPAPNYFGESTLTLCVTDGEFDACVETMVTVTSVNDAPYFASEMLPAVGVGIEFILPIVTGDIDSYELNLSLTLDEMNPPLVSLEDTQLIGVVNELGVYPIYLTLSDGEVSVLDTFDLHVEDFAAQITYIADVPNDQGGRVYVGFSPSYFDNGEDTGQSYSIFRRDLFSDSYDWVALSSVDAIGEDRYVFEALTAVDSTSDSDGMTEFKIVSSMSGGIFHSEFMMGYSVDNIHPGVPEGVMAMVSGNTVDLSWNESSDDDFQYYIIEKSVYDAIEIIETADAYYIDENYIPSEVHSYRVAAVDYAGNQSEFSELVEVAVLSVDVQITPVDFVLHQNYPNPFNPTTQIKYDLPSDSYVNISIYDVMGRKIKSLFNNNQTSGYYSLRWDATNDIGEGVSAGMYIYTIQAGEYRSTKKMVLLK